MNTEKFFEELGKVDNKYVIEAEEYKVENKNYGIIILKKIVSVAACLCFIIAASFGIYAAVPDSVTLENGEKLSFSKLQNISVGELDYDVKNIKEVSPEIKNTLFPDMNADGTILELPDGALGFEGDIGDVRTLVWTDSENFNDLIIEGREKTKEVNGVTVKAGRDVALLNAKRGLQVFYYIEFNIGNNTVYLERVDLFKNRKDAKQDLAYVFDKIIENKDFDLSKFK